MAKWTARHVPSLADLPKNLTIGRAYFVDDEHYIIIDHGNGPRIYGNRSGAQGQPGEPIPILQAQIDNLTEASFKHLFLIDELNAKRKNAIKNLDAKLDDNIQALDEKHDSDIKNLNARRLEDLHAIQQQLELASQGIITLTNIISTLSDNLRGTEAALLKLMLDNENNNPVTPLKQFELTTDDGLSYSVTTADDGTLIFTKN